MGYHHRQKTTKVPLVNIEKNDGNLWKIHHFWWVIYGKSSFYSYIIYIYIAIIYIYIYSYIYIYTHMITWEYIYIYSYIIIYIFIPRCPHQISLIDPVSFSTPSEPVPAPLGPAGPPWALRLDDEDSTVETWASPAVLGEISNAFYPSDPYLNNSRNMIYIYIN